MSDVRLLKGNLLRKIPTLFVRDPDNMSRVLDEVHPDCQWVIDVEGIATQKYDGTCVMYDGIEWWARREVKPGKAAPPDFVEVQHDPRTGKTQGWEPIAQSPFYKQFLDALEPALIEQRVGTYELIGPRINGNPERADSHRLICHEFAQKIPCVPCPGVPFYGFDLLVKALAIGGIEGVVWHHPDGRMAKLKGRDFL